LLYDEGGDEVKKVCDIVFSGVQHRYRRAPQLDDFVLPPSAASAIEEFIAASFDEQIVRRVRTLMSARHPSSRNQEVQEGTSASFFAERLRLLLRLAPEATRSETSAAFSELAQHVESLLLKHVGERKRVRLAFAREVMNAASYTQGYFYTAVRYLGPLRDEPRSFYPLEALGNPTDIGYRGEHTAAVLDLHKDVSVEFFSSKDIERFPDRSPKRRAPLHRAVIDWLSYMGVAEDVSTIDRGTLGHQLRVQPGETADFYDLTNVGVGVSQVLPIVVMTLLAESPCLLIFEQPELHLHPKVQARLADFFLAASLLGKQCILETHSEYMVERFRRRIAEAEGGKLEQQLKIYFTEKRDGETTCRPVHVSRYGAIADWPKDFFDQSQLETERILMAARRKRKLERHERDEG
jgi:predicted ATPase